MGHAAECEKRSVTSIIIPAHNEARVIGRLLDTLASRRLLPGTEVIVVCNGCTDDTADQARWHGAPLDARVVELPIPSKTAALNEGDRVAAGFPRIYLDADVVVSPAAIHAVSDALASGVALAARPPFRYDMSGADLLVRAYYRARERTPALMSALWGAGCYAVSEAGRSRWEHFPEHIADDFFVNSLFASHEKQVVDTDPIVVSVPRSLSALQRTLHRVYSPGHEPEAALDRASTAQTLLAVLRGNARSPRHALDALGYLTVAVGGRLPRRRLPSANTWARDHTTR